MKKLNSLCVLLFFAVLNYQAQTVLYSNDFQNPGSFLINNNGNTTNPWVINNSYQGGSFFFGLITIPSVPSQPAGFSNSGQNYLHPMSSLPAGNNIFASSYMIPFGNTTSAYMNTSIDASNYENVTLSFWRTGGANGLSVVYSLDGGVTWLTAVASVTGNPTTWQEEVFIINALDGQSDVRIGFRLSASVTDPAPNHYHSIDEITITGTPLNVEPPGDGPVNDQPCGAIDVTSAGQQDLNTYAFLADMTCNNQTGNNSSATSSPVGASCGGTNGRAMWYTFTTPMCDVNGTVPFEIEFSTNNAGTNFNTKLAIFESSTNDCGGVFTELACNDDHNGIGNPSLCNTAGTSSSTIVSSNLQPNKQYWVYVDGFNAAFGDFVLSGRALTAPHGVATTGSGTQIQLTTTNMGAAMYTYYYKQVGSTGYATANSQSALSDVRTLTTGNDYLTQILYRCTNNFIDISQHYRTAPQLITLESTCAQVNDLACTFNGNGSYTLTWTQPAGELFTNNGALSGYVLRRQVQGTTGFFTYSNPQPVCVDGTCTLTVTGNANANGYNWWLLTRCSANTTQQSNTTSCGPLPGMVNNPDASNNSNKSMINDMFSFVNAQAGIEFVDVQMHDAYGDFGLDVPMIGDYEVYVNENNEINWRRVETSIDANFDFVIVPNPSNAMTTVFLNTIVEEGSFTVIDAMGRTINSGSINNTDNVNIDAAQLQSGVYLVVVTVGNQKMTRRLVVAN